MKKETSNTNFVKLPQADKDRAQLGYILREVPEATKAPLTVQLGLVYGVRDDMRKHAIEKDKEKVSAKSKISCATRLLKHKFIAKHGELERNTFLSVNNYGKVVALMGWSTDEQGRKVYEEKAFYRKNKDFTVYNNINADLKALFLQKAEATHREYISSLERDAKKPLTAAKRDAKFDPEWANIKNLRPHKLVQDAVTPLLNGENEDFNKAAMVLFDEQLKYANRLHAIVALNEKGDVEYKEVLKENVEPMDFYVGLNVIEMPKNNKNLTAKQYLANQILMAYIVAAIDAPNKDDLHTFLKKEVFGCITNKLRAIHVFRNDLNKETGIFEFKNYKHNLHRFLEAMGISRHKTKFVKRQATRHLFTRRFTAIGLLGLTKLLGDVKQRLDTVSYDDYASCMHATMRYNEHHSLRKNTSIVAGSDGVKTGGHTFSFPYKKKIGRDTEIDCMANAYAKEELYEYLQHFDGGKLFAAFDRLAGTIDMDDFSYTEIVNDICKVHEGKSYEENLKFYPVEAFNKSIEETAALWDNANIAESVLLEGKYGHSYIDLREYIDSVMGLVVMSSQSYADEKTGKPVYINSFSVAASGRIYGKDNAWRLKTTIKELLWADVAVNMDAQSCHPKLITNIVQCAYKDGFLELTEEEYEKVIKGLHIALNEKHLTDTCKMFNQQPKKVKTLMNAMLTGGMFSYSQKRLALSFNRSDMTVVERFIKDNNINIGATNIINCGLKSFCEAGTLIKREIDNLIAWRDAQTAIKHENTSPQGVIEMSKDLYSGVGFDFSKKMSYLLQSSEMYLTAIAITNLCKKTNGKIKVISHEHDGVILGAVGKDTLTEGQRAYIAHLAAEEYKAAGKACYPNGEEVMVLREKYFYSADSEDKNHPYKIRKWESLSFDEQKEVVEELNLDAPVEEKEISILPSYYDVEEKNKQLIYKHYYKNFKETSERQTDKSAEHEAVVGDDEELACSSDVLESVLVLMNNELSSLKAQKAPDDYILDRTLEELKNAYSFLSMNYPEDDNKIRSKVNDRLIMKKFINAPFSHKAMKEAARIFSNHKTCV